MIEQFIAGTIVAACAVCLLRLVVGEPSRRRFDAALRRAWRRAVEAFYRFRASRTASKVIRRARRGDGGEWKGNVYKPKSFRRPRKPH